MTVCGAGVATFWQPERVAGTLPGAMRCAPIGTALALDPSVAFRVCNPMAFAPSQSSRAPLESESPSASSPALRLAATPADLAADLRRAMRGEVRFDAGSRALYATDGSNYRQPPIGVVIPTRRARTSSRGMDVCRAHGAPIFGRGGGTSLAGQCCNTGRGLRLVEVHESRAGRSTSAADSAVVQPGTILDDLRSRRRAARADVRSRSRDARPLHAGRHGRQRLVRRAFGDGAVRRPGARGPPTTSRSSRC